MALTILEDLAGNRIGRAFEVMSKGDAVPPESSMPVSDSLFCFTSNKVDIHPCQDCRAPMLVRTKSIGLDECFNCDNVVDNVVVVPGDPSGPSL